MENHVSGEVTASSETPNPLAALRQAILAVYIGNPLFTPEEQLLANHQAHEYEGEQELAHWLREARREDALRGFVVRLRAVRAWAQSTVCLDEVAQDAELLSLLHCSALQPPQKAALASLFTFSSIGPTSRLRLLGDGYMRVMGERGSAEPLYELEGIYEN